MIYQILIYLFLRYTTFIRVVFLISFLSVTNLEINKRRMIILKNNYNRKNTISVKMFISEFGENFSKHLKKRLMELEVRCLLTRKEFTHLLDLKHVEHLKYQCNYEEDNASEVSKKEYAYAQFAVIEGVLYFSESCIENDKIMQSPMVSTIYNSLDSEDVILHEGRNLKRIDDSNIDYVIDSILESCPDVSQSYLDIVKGMVSRANYKFMK